MNKLTSEMKSTHKIGLGSRRINCLRPVVRQTSSSPYIFAYISKNMLGWIPIVFVYIACTGSYQAAMGPPFSSKKTHVQCLPAYRTSVRSPHRSRTQNCEKNPIRQVRGQRTRIGENRKLQLLQLRGIDGEFSERPLGYLEVSKAQFN